MDTAINFKQFTLSSLMALICGAIFIITVPILALFVLDVFISFASVFDPLHQGGNIEKVWVAFFGIIVIQVIFPVLASVVAGIASSFLTYKIKTGMAYLLGACTSLVIYCMFQMISIIFVGLFAGEVVVISWFLTSMAIVGFFSPFIGLILIAVNRKLG